MSNPPDSRNSYLPDATTRSVLEKSVHVAVRLGVLFLLMSWSYRVVRPLLEPIVWGALIAVATYPYYARLRKLLWGKNALSATLFGIMLALVFLVPATILASSLVRSVRKAAEAYGAGTITLPEPPEVLASIPVLGANVSEVWQQAVADPTTLLEKYKPQLDTLRDNLVAGAATAGLQMLGLVAALVIAAILLAYADGAQRASQSILRRLAPERGDALHDLCVRSIRSVAQGIVGIAIIQAGLAGLGFAVFGMPSPGIWAFVVLVLAICQLPVVLVLLPMSLIAFGRVEPAIAVTFLVWNVFVGLVDNLLKPLLLARGVDVPMIVILIGAIGGMVASGIVGLFLGPVILAVTYTLLVEWFSDPNPQGAEESAPAAPSGASDDGPATAAVP